MTDLDTLTSLRERVIAAEGPDRELDIDIARGTDQYWLAGAVVKPSWEGDSPEDIIWRKSENEPAPNSTGWYHGSIEFHTASIDAALGLVERVLPGQHLTIGQNAHHHYWLCTFNKLDDEGAPISNGSSHAAPTPPLAILAALLSALIANAKGET